MNTILSNWQAVTIIEGEHKIGEVLWGICVDDMTCRFSAGDYVCTSRITDFNSYTKLVKTTSGSLYQILGEGKQAFIDFHDFELLRQGFCPEQINALKRLAHFIKD